MRKRRSNNNTSNTSNFSMHIASHTKADLEEIFGNLGMSITEAVNIFFAKALMVGGLPFDVRLPEFNEETMAALKPKCCVIVTRNA